jgi:hypothetical protein
MDETFVAEFEVVEPIINRMIRCPDVAAIAIVLAWLSWSRKPDVPLKSHVCFAVRQALSGRDLPEVQSSKFRDIWDHATCWGGAGMQDVVDPAPGPDKLAEDAEAYPVWEACLTNREREAAEMYLEGFRNKDVAERLGTSQGRATQLRGQMAERWKELE